jgi:hypothetical protein
MLYFRHFHGQSSIYNLFRNDPAFGPPQIGGPTHRRRACAVADQAMAESAGGREGWRRAKAHEWRQEQHARHASGWCREPAEALPFVAITHAGTKREGSNLIADGGRVLNVTGLGANVAEARARAYAAAGLCSH